jgi:transposase
MSALEQALKGPAIEVVANATRRRFTVEYKRKILREANACKTSGAGGALLRREGLYSSHLTTWRAARERGELAAAPKKRGPVPRVPDPRDRWITELERESVRWRKRAERAEALVELQEQGQGCSAGFTRRSASKRPWLGADNGLYAGYAHRRLTT